MEKLRRAESVLLGMESALLVALLVFLVGMSFLQVLLRQFFGGGTLWGDTLLRHLVLWVGFLGAARASAEEKHFAFDALAERLPLRWRKAAGLAARLCAVLVSLLLAKASWAFMLDERAAGSALCEIGRVSLPGWPFAAILPLGFALAALHTLLRAARVPAPDEGPP